MQLVAHAPDTHQGPKQLKNTRFFALFWRNPFADFDDSLEPSSGFSLHFLCISRRLDQNWGSLLQTLPHTHTITQIIVRLIIIIIMIMGTFNARHIYPIGYSRRRCGATAALIRQPQTHPHNEEPEIRNRILWEGVRFLACRRKPECPEKTYQGGHGIGKPNSRTTTGKLHWWKTKCSST